MSLRRDQNRTIAIKEEATPGTPETSFSSANAPCKAYEHSFSPELEKERRTPYSPFFGSDPSVAGPRSGTVSFKTDMLPSANHQTDDPPWAPYFRACGGVIKTLKALSVTVTMGAFVAGDTVTCNGETAKVAQFLNATGTLYVYDQSGAFTNGAITSNGGAVGSVTGGDAATVGRVGVLSSAESDHKHSTIRDYNDGHLDIIAGALGNMKLESRMGESAKLMFDFRGKLLESAEEPLLIGEEPSIRPVSYRKSSLSLKPGSAASYTPDFEVIDLDLANEIALPKNANEVTGAGYSIAVMRRAEPIGQIDALATTKSEHDWRTHAEEADVGPLSFLIGETTNQRFIVHCPKVEYGTVSEGERAFRTTYTVPLMLHRNRGDDELFILML